MSGSVPRPKRLTSGAIETLDRWAEQADPKDRNAVQEALMSVVEGSWPQRYDHFDDVTHPLQVYLVVRPGLLITLRFATEYPSYVQVPYIGSPDSV